jgi:hypothetical protein
MASKAEEYRAKAREYEELAEQTGETTLRSREDVAEHGRLRRKAPAVDTSGPKARHLGAGRSRPGGRGLFR